MTAQKGISARNIFFPFEADVMQNFAGFFLQAS
jgi:hypothetical protein